MVDFEPKFTETIFLDIECYVPPERRQLSKSSMIYNPAIAENFVLGGVFRRGFPLQNRFDTLWQVWNWKREDEGSTLEQIYDYFRESWKMLEGKTNSDPDLILVGTGISRLDVPTLYVRSVMHNIDNAPSLYETYFKTKIVDLGDVGITLFRNNPKIYPLYPKTTNALKVRFGIQGRKTSGKSVWEMYESQEFESIKERTTAEVEDEIEIASRLISGRFNLG